MPLTDILLLMVILEESVSVLPLLMTIFRNVVVPVSVCAVPEKVTCALATDALYVPEFVQLPLSVIVRFAELARMVPLLPIVTLPDTLMFLATVSVEAILPDPMVSDLQADVLVRVGWLLPVKLASPIIASMVAVGTPAVQLEAVLQFVLVAPVQEV